jgi:4'-phosphopantetheinyl transferase
VAGAASVPALTEGEVHAWRFALGEDGPVVVEREVNADDLERADRFVFERDRSRFLRARHVMRDLLGAYVGGEPQGHAIVYGPYGKPGVDPELGIGFNVSHSGDHGLIAFARGAEVGVDIEEVCLREGMRGLVGTVMSPDEEAALRDIPDAAFALPFLTCWTRKEACLKALGVGLAMDPRTVSVGIRAVRSHVSVPPAGSMDVEVTSLFQDGRCVGALAVAGGYTRAHLLEWAP